MFAYLSSIHRGVKTSRLSFSRGSQVFDVTIPNEKVADYKPGREYEVEPLEDVAIAIAFEDVSGMSDDELEKLTNPEEDAL